MNAKREYEIEYTSRETGAVVHREKYTFTEKDASVARTRVRDHGVEKACRLTRTHGDVRWCFRHVSRG